MKLGEYLTSIQHLVDEGSDPDGCIVCKRTGVLLHPVGRAWACSRCHTPPEDGKGKP